MGLLSRSGDVLAVLYIYLAVAFALMMSVFHHSRLVRRRDDFRAFLLYFVLFCMSFWLAPFIIVLAMSADPVQTLASFGFTAGRAGRGLLLAAVSIPVVLVLSFTGSHDAAMQERYPFSKSACDNLGKFLLFEFCYLVLYYVPWEFLFRGLLFFPLIPAVGLVPALGIQTVVSTLYHFGHPDMEIFAAAAGGIVFGLIAYATGSFLYTIFIHAFLGIATDSFLYARLRRKANAHARA
jgi:membrane protease YdiL (CAAX protease family)